MNYWMMDNGKKIKRGRVKRMYIKRVNIGKKERKKERMKKKMQRRLSIKMKEKKQGKRSNV